MAGMVDKELAIELMKFVQFVQTNLLPIHEQKHVGELGKDFFCVDWWTIEVCKCLFNGEQMYVEDPPPWRLRDNKNFDKQKIIKDAKKRLETIEMLKLKHSEKEILIIHNVGRGLELVLANHFKQWDRAICYDKNIQYGPLLDMYFREKLGMNIEFNPEGDGPIDVLVIDPKCGFFDGTAPEIEEKV